MAKIDLKQNSDCKFSRGGDESLENLTSNCTVNIDNGEIPSLKPAHLPHFIEALRLDGEL